MGDLYFSVSESHLKYWVQVIVFVMIIFFIYQSVAFIYTILSASVLTIVLLSFLKQQRKLSSFAFLEKNTWTFEYQDGITTKEVYLILDHQLYFTFCFSKTNSWSTEVVWKDQLVRKDFKKMKALARLYHYSDKKY